MPTLGLRRPPPTRPVSRTTGPEDRRAAVLGWRLPSVVAPPPDGALMLVPLPMRPCNISVDPRLCKGSVFASRRQHFLEAQAQGVRDTQEGRYKVNVLRSRLESSLPHFPPSKLPNAQKVSLPKTSLLRKQSAPRKRAPEPVQLPQLSPGSIDKGFRKLKFLPLRNVSNVEEAGQRSLPSRVVPALRKVRIKPPPMISEATTPPCSERPEYPIVTTAVQTDDSFDEETYDLVRDLANSAIEQAIYNLQVEETLLGLTKRTEDIQKQLEQEKQLKKELEVTSKKALEAKEKEIGEAKRREEEALTANRLAVITCKEITAKSLLRIKAMEEINPRTKSIGLDTRQLNSLQKQLDLVHAELEKDFFPWIFARAERIYRNRCTTSHLLGTRRKSKKTF